jgi:polysaccharide export outer membrane protein
MVSAIVGFFEKQFSAAVIEVAVQAKIQSTGWLSVPKPVFAAVAIFVALISSAVFAQDGSAPVAGVADANASSGASAAYVIGPGDVLQVFVWRNDDLSVNVPVRPDGRITTPLVEEMMAAGKTAARLARDIESVLAEYIRSPQVNVIVVTPQSLMNEVKVIGQVATPQAVPYTDGMTVLDLLLQAGGLTEFAAGNRSKLVRAENGQQVEHELRLNNLINKGDLRENLALRPGDLLVVPESRF